MTKLLDCTLRDGGYYNNWDFRENLIKDYLSAMEELDVDYVEIGFRTLNKNGFKGGLAYSTDDFLRNLKIPKGLSKKIGVMINGSEIENPETQKTSLEKLFCNKEDSPVSLVRIACHAKEFNNCLPASEWLKEKGYLVGINLMQISEISLDQIAEFALKANSYPIDVLYFADSLGSLDKDKLFKIIEAFKKNWKGDLGIHTHDNMCQAISNTKFAIKSNIKWVDSTVTGMGRGPGNAQTEYLIIELSKIKKTHDNTFKFLGVVEKHFRPLQSHYGWGTNLYYFLAGKYGIHPTYIQEMIQDKRYDEADILSVIENLKIAGSKNFSLDTLEASKHFYLSEPKGKWLPESLLKNKKILILGTGPGIKKYKLEIENFIKKKNPYVIALNTESNIEHSLIDARASCHPLRLLADCKDHINFPQPLITPYSMLPEGTKRELSTKKIFDFGIKISNKKFNFHKNYCELPTSLVIGYVLAIANSGKAKEIILAGFDGHDSDDIRRKEMDHILSLYFSTSGAIPIKSITPTKYDIFYRINLQLVRLKTIIIIPARYNSSRFPGKPLKKICNKTLIEWVSELSAKAVERENVYIATDNSNIYDTVVQLGYKAVMTSDQCLTGTDRLAEVSKSIHADIYINVQGDEPLVNPNDIKRVIDAKKKYPNDVINCYTDIKENEDPNDKNIPKVIFNEEQKLIYISRQALPGFKNNKNKPKGYFKQVCIYAFNKEELQMFSQKAKKSLIEISEDIEILRFFEFNKTIRLIKTNQGSLAIDTPEDIEKVERVLRKKI